MKRYVSLEHLVEKHTKHKQFHKQLTKHTFMVIVVVAALFLMTKMLPSLTGFAVAGGENIAKSAATSSSMLNTIKQSENRILFEIYLWIVWLVTVIIISIVSFEHEIKTRKW